ADKTLTQLCYWSKVFTAEKRMDQETDPFSVDQQALEEKLKALQRSFDRWRALKSADSHEHGDGHRAADAVPADLLQDEFRWLTDELVRSLKSLTWELNDLHETLRSMLQHQPPGSQQSASVTDNRRLFISNTRALLASIESEVQPPASSSGQPPHQLRINNSTTSADDGDVELLLGEESVSAGQLPRPSNRGNQFLHLVKRYRAALVCLALILGLAFLLWVFYEAVLSSGPTECVCTTATSKITASSVTTAATTADSSANSSV
ncbi:hypothetical protein BOX15_Mlig024633g1, partial [Macrostomum lignano]